MTSALKFSIILPVHNGMEYIKECIDSILKQNYSSFDLIVLENGSTDGTLEWLQSISDNRLKIFPTDTFISMKDNWIRIKDVPKNEFFAIIAHDDLLDNDYLEVMNRLIRKDPNATLYQTHFRYINSQGEFDRNCLPMAETQHSYEFLANQFQRTFDSMGTGYMMRTSDFNKVGGFSSYHNLIFGDLELWFKLTDIGYKATAIEECFSYREHNSISVRTSVFEYKKALFKYLFFMKNQALRNNKLNIIINRYLSEYLHYMCKGLIYRELLNKQHQNSDATIVKDFQSTSIELLPHINTNFNNDIYIKFYLFLDRIIIGRSIFRGLVFIKSKVKLMIMNKY